MNVVTLIGRATKEIELRKTQTGTSVVSFNLAVNRKHKQEGQPEADFIRCQAWGKTAEVLNSYVSKGQEVGITGRIQTGSYKDKDGKTVYTTDVIVSDITFVGSKNSNNQPAQQESYTQDSVDEYQQDLDIASDDLPF